MHEARQQLAKAVKEAGEALAEHLDGSTPDCDKTFVKVLVAIDNDDVGNALDAVEKRRGHA